MPTDERFDADGVAIAYDDLGTGPPIVLVHGFASDRTRNWRDAEWYDALTDAGRRVIALDCRGHGDSGKPRDPEAYAYEAMPGDVLALLDHLSIETADLMGYSMGGRIAQVLLVERPERFNAVILAGVGERNLRGEGDRSGVAEALEADDPDTIEDPRARGFREFAESQGNDLAALAAYQRAPRTTVDAAQLADVSRPVLVVNGADDDLGDPRAVAEEIPGAEAAVVPDRDHITTVADRQYKEYVLDFLEREGLPA